MQQTLRWPQTLLHKRHSVGCVAVGGRAVGDVGVTRSDRHQVIQQPKDLPVTAVGAVQLLLQRHQLHQQPRQDRLRTGSCLWGCFNIG